MVYGLYQFQSDTILRCILTVTYLTGFTHTLLLLIYQQITEQCHCDTENKKK